MPRRTGNRHVAEVVRAYGTTDVFFVRTVAMPRHTAGGNDPGRHRE